MLPCGHLTKHPGCHLCRHADQPGPTGDHYRSILPPSSIPLQVLEKNRLGASSGAGRVLERAAHLECKYLGAETGRMVRCPTCTGEVNLKTLACEVHGECTVGRKADGTACCVGCPQKEVGVRKLSWECGVTTVPERFGELLPKTLASIEAAGFPKPRLFVDGGAEDYSGLAGYSVTERMPKVKTFANWYLGLLELYLRNPKADRYAMFQDDVSLCRNVRGYLESVPWQPNTYLNLYTTDENVSVCPKGVLGPFRSKQRGRGALALVFDREGVQALLSAPVMVKRPMDPVRAHRSLDGAIIDSLGPLGWSEMCVMPSLARHTGNRSVMHPGLVWGDGEPDRRTDSYRGEGFDCLELVKG